MLNVRRFSSRAVSFHIALAVTFVFSMVAVKATTCPPPPKPLRILYKQSEKIVVAQLENITDEKILGEDKNYTRVLVRNVFSVSSTLKGKSEPYLVIYETDYRDKNLPEVKPETKEPAESAESEETETDEDDEERFKIGKRLLLFLSKGEESDGYSLVDYGYGAKELSDADLQIYEKRIKEIASILASPERQTERTVEWLVRCAEEPATRWEGAYELDMSFDYAEYEDESEAEEKAARERGDVKIPQENNNNERMLILDRSDYDSAEDARFAKMLSNSQKNRLTNALINTLGASKGKVKKSDDEGLSEGDSALLDLVGRWNEQRLVPALLANLQNSYIAQNYDTVRFINLLARLLKNEKLESLAESYEEIHDEPDEEIANTESENAENEEENESEQKSAENKNESETIVESAEETPEKMTYKQRREQLLNEFIAECQVSLAKPIESAKVVQKR